MEPLVTAATLKSPLLQNVLILAIQVFLIIPPNLQWRKTPFPSSLDLDSFARCPSQCVHCHGRCAAVNFLCSPVGLCIYINGCFVCRAGRGLGKEGRRHAVHGEGRVPHSALSIICLATQHQHTPDKRIKELQHNSLLIESTPHLHSI